MAEASTVVKEKKFATHFALETLSILMSLVEEGRLSITETDTGMI
jgi:hypothetical protein